MTSRANRERSGGIIMTTEPGLHLGHQAFLLGYDPKRQKFTTAFGPDDLVRAAVLAELVLRGRIVDHEGRIEAVGPPTGQPSLDHALDHVTGRAKPRSWAKWISSSFQRRGEAALVDLVRHELAAQRIIAIRDRTVLRIITTEKNEVRDVVLVKRVITDVHRAQVGSTPVSQVPPGLGALAALAAACDLDTVSTWRERREHRDRIQQLGAPIRPVAAGLRKVVQDARSSA